MDALTLVVTGHLRLFAGLAIIALSVIRLDGRQH